MAQFIRKNRKKRKYIRHKRIERKVVQKDEKKPVKTAPKKLISIKLHKPAIRIKKIPTPKIRKPSQNTLTLLKKMGIVLGVLIAIYLLLQNFTISPVDIPQDAIKNNVIDVLNNIGRAILAIFDAIIFVFMSILWLLTQIWNWLVWIGGGIYNGLLIALSFIGSIFAKLFEGIVAVLNVLYVLFVQLLTFIWYVVVTITTVIINAIISMWQFITTQLGRFFYWIGTPFRTLAAFFEMLKPYLALLGHHIQGAFDVLREGFKTLTSLVSS